MSLTHRCQLLGWGSAVLPVGLKHLQEWGIPEKLRVPHLWRYSRPGCMGLYLVDSNLPMAVVWNWMGFNIPFNPNQKAYVTWLSATPKEQDFK